MKPNRPFGIALMLAGLVLVIYGLGEIAAFFMHWK
jgi:hypothetical protein